MTQLLLFQENKQESIEKEVQRLREQCEKVRKGQYAKIGKMLKLYNDLSYEFETLKSSIGKMNASNQQH